MFEREQIPVHLCCNDPDNGNFAERLWGLQIGPDNLELTSTRWETFDRPWGPRLRYIADAEPTRPLLRAIKIAGREFPVTFYKPWYGNWCWDLVRMPGASVLELLNWPRFRKWFACEAGESRLYNWWHAGRQFQDEDLRIMLKGTL